MIVYIYTRNKYMQPYIRINMMVIFTPSDLCRPSPATMMGISLMAAQGEREGEGEGGPQGLSLSLGRHRYALPYGWMDG